MNIRANWKGLLLLFLIVPIGVFVGYKLAVTGLPTLETTTVTLAPVAWEFNKTSQSTSILETPNATYADDMSQMNFSVTLGIYLHPDIAIPYYTLDVGVRFAATPLNKDFSVRNVLVTFGNDPQPSAVSVQTYVWSFENLSLAAYSSGEDASIQLLGNSSSVGVKCQLAVNWYLYTPNNVTNSREVTYEVTCFNGTAYEKITQPFDLTLIGS